MHETSPFIRVNVEALFMRQKPNNTRLAKRREILIFPRTAGNTGNSREILVIPGNYWEIGSSPTR